MATNRKIPEAESLETYRVALKNALSPDILDRLETVGYDAAKIAKGQKLFAAADDAHFKALHNKSVIAGAYRAFSQQKEKLNTLYSVHRKKAKVIFRKDELMMQKLELSGRIPRTYTGWYEAIRTFYFKVSGEKDILKKLARVNISEDEIKEGLELLKSMDKTRAEYIYQKGDTQNYTDKKAKVFTKLDNWMSDFYVLARIAFADNPQQLESLGKLVKS